MRVNIQYSVELDEIPLEIENLINTTVVEKLTAISDALQALRCDTHATAALDTIDEARQALFAVDQRLSDVDSIFRGYLSQKSEAYRAPVEQAYAPAPMHPAPTTTGEPDVMLPASEETMTAIREQLAAHKVEAEEMKKAFVGLCPPSPYLEEEGGTDEEG